MTEPAKNRLHDYEAGWLTLLVDMGIATEAEAREAQCRVARAAFDEANARRDRRQAARERRRRRKEE